MVKSIRGSTKPERMRFLQLITSPSTIRYTLGTEPTSVGINEEKLEPNEFIVGCYGYLSRKFTQVEQSSQEESKEK